MNNANIPTPPDAKKEVQVFSLKSVAARNLGVTSHDIRLVNAESFMERRSRFLYGFTEQADHALVGQLTIEYPLTRAAPDPPKRRKRARSRRRRRLPFHTNGVWTYL